MNILVLDCDRVGLDFCLRAADAGHDVRWHRYSKRPTKDGAGFRQIQIVDDWRPSMKWASNGLILLTGNARFLPELERFRDFGLPIFGPSVASAELEIKRSVGMEAMRKAGIQVPPYKEFKSLEDAEAFARKSDRAWVFKTMGDNEDKSLSFVAHDPAELVGWIQQKIDAGVKLKGPCILQEKIDMLAELGVSGWFGPDGFLPDKWQYCFEHKKLYDGDLGPNVGEQGTVTCYTKTDKLAEQMLLPLVPQLKKLDHRGDFAVGCGVDVKGNAHFFEFSCYDNETEVLTKQGWKFFKDVAHGELMATLDPKTEHLEYRPNTAVLSKDYIGDLVHFSGDSNAPDLRVTPDHQMWARAKGKGPFKFMRADQVVAGRINGKNTGSQTEMQVKRDAKWAGLDVDTFYLPRRTEAHFLGRSKTIFPIDHPAIEMPMEVWVKFLGLYIAEGSLGPRKNGIPYGVNIAQKEFNHYKILPLLKGFPIPFTVAKSGALQFSNRQLAECIDGFGLGLCHEKFVPEYFKSLSPKYLSALLDGMMAGDGTTHKRSGQRTYFTTSKRLADDVQEIMLKLGYLGRIVKKMTAGTAMSVNGGPEYIRNHDGYIVCERRQKTFGWLDKRTTKRVPYHGKVYCVDVPPHHLLYVRRNGNPTWCGNCRLGWPEFYLQTAAHKDDPAQWMKDLLDGKDTLEVSYDPTIGVVLSQPPYPEEGKPEQVEGNIISGVDDEIEHLHLAGVMLGKGPVMKDGKIADETTYKTSSEYVMIATALGKTISAARENVYGTIENVHFANMAYRTDIGKRLEKCLPKLCEFGYCEGLKYGGDDQ